MIDYIVRADRKHGCIFPATAGGTVQTLVVEPGYFRHSLTSTDLKECFYEDACQGGVLLSEYCASGYKGPCERMPTKSLAVERRMATQTHNS